jgi:hypothetical protein
MILTREHCQAVTGPSAKKLALELSRTKQSFAHLAAADGSFVQVAGGPGLFLLERRDASGLHSRAFQSHPVASHPDGTLLQTSAGTFKLAQDEWFLLKQVVEVFAAFAAGEPSPSTVSWRKLGDQFVVEAALRSEERSH